MLEFQQGRLRNSAISSLVNRYVLETKLGNRDTVRYSLMNIAARNVWTGVWLCYNGR